MTVGVRFSDALRAARDALGLDQPKFGKLLGISKATVSRYETGDGLPPRAYGAHYVTRLANAHLPIPLLRPVIQALGLEGEINVNEPAPPPPPPPPPPAVPAPVAAEPPKPSPLEAMAAIDHVVYVTAERLELSPRALRDFLLDVLAHAQAAGLTLDDARRILLRALAPRPTPSKAKQKSAT